MIVWSVAKSTSWRNGWETACKGRRPRSMWPRGWKTTRVWLRWKRWRPLGTSSRRKAIRYRKSGGTLCYSRGLKLTPSKLRCLILDLDFSFLRTKLDIFFRHPIIKKLHKLSTTDQELAKLLAAQVSTLDLALSVKENRWSNKKTVNTNF